MRTIFRLNALLLLSTLVATLSSPSIFGQDSDAKKRAREVSRKARGLMNEGRYPDAIRTVAEANLRYAGLDRSATAIHDFTLGFLHQTEARRASDADPPNLTRRDGIADRGITAYLRVLERYPKNVAAARNLVLLFELRGPRDDTEAILTKVATTLPTERSGILSRLADIQARDGRLDAALATLDELTSTRPDDESAHAHVLRLTIEKVRAGGEARRLFELGRTLLDRGHPSLAAEAMSALVRRTWREPTADTWNACELWALVTGDGSNFSRRDLKPIPSPDKWDSPCVRELTSIADANLDTADTIDWWGKNTLRRHTAASLIRLVGRRLLREKKVEAAIRLLEIGLKIAPTFNDYKGKRHGIDFETLSWIHLDISRDLATLYHRHASDERLVATLGSLDQRFRELENRIVRDKTGTYRRRDLRAMQRFHTTLALIYVERDKWTSDDIIRNATFQLRRAVSVAADREALEGTPYQPLPRLWAMFAQGLEHQGQLQAARDALVRAAVGHLDVDLVDDADQLLSRARRLEATRPARLEKAAFEVVKVRRALPRVGLARPANLRRTVVEANRQIDLLATPAVSGPERPFYDRQRFKARADLAGHIREADRQSEGKFGTMATWQENQALGEALTLGDLGGFGDVRRLRDIQESLARVAKFETKRPLMQTHALTIDRGTDTSSNSKRDSISWRIGGGSDDRTMRIELDSDVRLAHEVIKTMSPKLDQSSAIVPFSIQRRGNVILDRSVTDTLRKKLDRKIGDTLRRRRPNK